MATVRPRPVMANTSFTGIKNGLSTTRCGAGFEKGKLVERPREAPDDRIDEVSA
jgi:hypothetical protein